MDAVATKHMEEAIEASRQAGVSEEDLDKFREALEELENNFWTTIIPTEMSPYWVLKYPPIPAAPDQPVIVDRPEVT